MLSLLAIVLLIATLMTLFYQQISRGIGSAVFVIVWRSTWWILFPK